MYHEVSSAREALTLCYLLETDVGSGVLADSVVRHPPAHVDHLELESLALTPLLQARVGQSRQVVPLTLRI